MEMHEKCSPEGAKFEKNEKFLVKFFNFRTLL